MVRVVLIGFALLAAAAAGWMVKLYLSAQREQIAEMAQQVAKPVPTTEVLVVNSDLDVASVLSSSDLRWQAWPDLGLHPHYITRRSRPDAIETLAGSAARQPLIGGEPVSEEKLILKQSGGFLAAVLPQGERAITLKVDEATGVAGLLIPGDHVDIILTHEVPVKTGDSGSGTGGATEKRFVGETIVRDLVVLAVDQELRRDDKAAKLGKTVTLAVDVGQAEAIALGRSLGNLTLSLRSAFGSPKADDRQRPFTSATDISGALRDSEKALPPPALSLSAPSSAYTVTVYHGLNAETVTLGR